jgi:hypothetical protein
MAHQETTEFSDWLRTGTRGLVFRFCVALVLVALAAELFTATTSVPATARVVSDYLTRALAIVGPLLFIAVMPAHTTKLSGDAESCATHFAKTWRLCLLSWIVMGLFFFASHICISPDDW